MTQIPSSCRRTINVAGSPPGRRCRKHWLPRRLKSALKKEAEKVQLPPRGWEGTLVGTPEASHSVTQAVRSVCFNAPHLLVRLPTLTRSRPLQERQQGKRYLHAGTIQNDILLNVDSDRRQSCTTYWVLVAHIVACVGILSYREPTPAPVLAIDYWKAPCGLVPCDAQSQSSAVFQVDLFH